MTINNKITKTNFKELDNAVNSAINENKNKVVEQPIKVKKIKFANAYNKLIEKFNFDEKYTKIHTKIKYDNIKGLIPPLANFNFMADLLMLPETSNGYKYLFVIVDLWSNKFDCEPIANKTADNCLKAMKKMFLSGKYIKMPYASIATDNGTEFKGVFNKFLWDNNIFHKLSYPYRHKQMSVVENLNKLLYRFFGAYMNKREKELGKTFTDWTDILPQVKEELNKIRAIPDENPFTYDYALPIMKEPKFKIGDVVYHRLERPINELGHIENGGFRTGDIRFSILMPRKITKILFYPKNIRYILENMPNVSYTEDELMISQEKESKYIVRKIIGKRKMPNNKIYYLVWWKYTLKKNSTYEPKDILIEDGCKKLIDDYEKSIN